MWALPGVDSAKKHREAAAHPSRQRMRCLLCPPSCRSVKDAGPRCSGKSLCFREGGDTRVKGSDVSHAHQWAVSLSPLGLTSKAPHPGARGHQQPPQLHPVACVSFQVPAKVTGLMPVTSKQVTHLPCHSSVPCGGFSSVGRWPRVPQLPTLLQPRWQLLPAA